MKKIILLFLIISIPPVFAQSSLAPVTLESDKARYIANTATLEGNVVATSKDYTLTAEKLTVITNDAREIERIISENKVNFKSGDIIAVAEKAELNQAKKTIVLTGEVKIYKGENYLEGDRVSIQYETQEIDITGKDSERVTIIFNPDNLGDMKGIIP